MSRILLTAVGSMAAPPAMESYRLAGHQVLGCDIYPRHWNPSSMAMDAFFQARYAAEGEAYLQQLLAAVKEYHLDFLIPLTDVEIDALAPFKHTFAELGCMLCVPNEAVTRLLRAKDEMTRFLSANPPCSLIPTLDPYPYTPTEADYPLMLKPRSGRSSQGQRMVNSLEEYRAALAARSDYLAQPFLSGPIWTVDVARDAFGNIQALARQELLRNPSGLGVTVAIVPDHPLEEIAARIAHAVQLIGVVNIEFIQHEDDFFFLEVNPRFSGGMGFSCLAGVNFPILMLQCHAGEAIGPRPSVAPMTLARQNQIVITSREKEGDNPCTK